MADWTKIEDWVDTYSELLEDTTVLEDFTEEINTIGNNVKEYTNKMTDIALQKSANSSSKPNEAGHAYL